MSWLKSLSVESVASKRRSFSPPQGHPAAVASAQVGPDRAARAVGGQPHHAVGHLGDVKRNGHRAGRGRHGHLVSVGEARRRPRWRRRPAPRPAARFPPGTARRPASGPRRSAVPGSEPDAGIARAGRAGATRQHSGAAGRAPFQAPGRRARRERRPRRQSQVDVHLVAIAPSTYRSVRMPGTLRAALNVAPRPSQLTNVPAFSATAATGNTTSARSVTALARNSSETMNGVLSSATSAAAGSGRSAASTPGDDQRAQLAAGRGRASSAAVERPGVAGRVALFQASATSARAWGRPPSGRSAAGPASRPPRSAPRSPARRGTQASFAPLASASRRRRRARREPRPAARRPGSPRRAWPAVSAARAMSVVAAAARGERGQRGGLGPGHGRQQRAEDLGQSRRAQRARRRTPRGGLAGRLAQPQEHDRGLVLRLEPGQQHRRRGLRSA